MKAKLKVLFICKKRTNFYGPSFGLINSCKFIVNALNKNGIEAKVVTILDNNDIDREVKSYRASHVFIEALWVVPSKFQELIPLHPTVQWFVRIHSKIPFLSNEGMAMQWLREYDALSKAYPQLHIASNSEETVEAFKMAYGIDVLYFPNIYEPPAYIFEEDNCNCDDDEDTLTFQGIEYKKHDQRKQIDIGCFGAIRPMKNQLLQALAAMSFGNKMRFKVNFHINSDRAEDGGDPVLKNLIYAFKDTSHKLVFHPWMNHSDFIPVVRKMDIGLQVSMSETFNIVAADFVWNNIPLVGSDEISWLDRRYKANFNSLESMMDKMVFAYQGKKHDIQKVNFENLEKYNKRSLKIWLTSL